MRLLCTDSSELKLAEFMGDPPKPYAIVSHRWEQEEVLFADIGGPGVCNKLGYRKIAFAINQARADGYSYLWVDTCCIDKSSSAELSEAINSMYYWYQQAGVCYAYLSDIRSPTCELGQNRWFTRGWTLQELLAPRVVVFFTCDWHAIGTKESLCQLISNITEIPLDILDGSAPIQTASVSRRMSWASMRETTRVEDMAYCLLGLFSVSMPLLYGERDQAFVRLQEEIIKVTDDQTLFAWIDPNARPQDERGMLAEHPRFFKHSANFVPCTDPESQWPHSMTNRRLRIEVRLANRGDSWYGRKVIAHLSCCKAESTLSAFAIQLKPDSLARNEYRRIVCNDMWTGVSVGDLISVIVPQNAPTSNIHRRREVYLVPDQLFVFRNLQNESGFKVQLLSCATRIDPDDELASKVSRSMNEILQVNRRWMPESMPPFFIGQRVPNRIAFAVRFDVFLPGYNLKAQMLLAIGIARCKNLGIWVDKSTANHLTVDDVQSSETDLKAGKRCLTNIPIYLSSANVEKQLYAKIYMSLDVTHVIRYPGDCYIIDWRFHRLMLSTTEET